MAQVALCSSARVTTTVPIRCWVASKPGKSRCQRETSSVDGNHLGGERTLHGRPVEIVDRKQQGGDNDGVGGVHVMVSSLKSS